MQRERIIQDCDDCKDISVFAINEYQDPFYVDGKRLRECIACGRYEDVEENKGCKNDL